MSINNTCTSIRILVAEDESGIRNLISLALKHQGYSADFAEDTADAIERLHHSITRYSAVLIDMRMSGNVAGVITEAHQSHPPIPVIAIADPESSGTGRISADKIITESLTGEILRNALQSCLSVRHSEPLSVDAACVAPASVWRLEIESLVRHVAASDVPVLVRGETGSGKEVLARQMHALSARARKPFLKVNCAALPSELIESELFGYERGAFTGAFKTTPGKFEMAEGGTILLDEIGDMDFKLQAKLLQVLQDSEFIRLGSSETRRVDVRVMAATHCDLERAISEKGFREDLYYRLNVITIEVPPLRSRKEEILPLAHYFMRKYVNANTPAVEITPGLRDALLCHEWPGNVRELENVIRKLLVLRRSDLVIQDIERRVLGRNAAFMAMNPMRGVERLQAINCGRETFDAALDEIDDGPPVSSFSTAQRSALKVMAATATGANLEMVAGAGEDFHRNEFSQLTDRSSILERVDEARREAETEAILTALKSTLWNRKRAADLLNIDYKALLYKMKKLEIVERAAKIAI